jgi:putative hydrolase of the HAD superfamily
MIDCRQIGGILFDYGGTIDSNGVHWGEVIRRAYEAEHILFPDKSVFRDAYVHGERTLGRNPLILPRHTFSDMMHLKIRLQFDRLTENGFLRGQAAAPETARRIADRCYAYAARSTDAARPVIAALAKQYRLALVSNFYGNLNAVLADFKLKDFFPVVVESAVVGVRKPDPQIFRLGVEALRLPPDEVAAVGDSYDKDIVPATTAGCRTVWLKKTGWNDYAGHETADVVISDFPELREIFLND